MDIKKFATRIIGPILMFVILASCIQNAPKTFATNIITGTDPTEGTTNIAESKEINLIAQQSQAQSQTESQSQFQSDSSKDSSPEIIDESQMESINNLLTIPSEYALGKVEKISTGAAGDTFIHVRVNEGSQKGKLFRIAFDPAGLHIQPGDDVIIGLSTEGKTTKANIIEGYRFPGILLSFLLFLIVAIAVGGKKGGFALGGLIITLLVLLVLVIPLIVAGWNPFWASFGGALVIAVISLYVSHGFHKRTTISLVSTLITLLIAAIAAIFFVWICHLTGMGTEETMLLQLNAGSTIDLRGLLLGGIILGALGVLDDITTSQAAAIEEIYQANTSLSRKELLRRGLSVGREHIASLINTLFLAYAGASFPLLLLLSTANNEPLWVTLNHEYMVEEIVRTLAGSLALILAVPLTTWLAAYVFSSKSKNI